MPKLALNFLRLPHPIGAILAATFLLSGPVKANNPTVLLSVPEVRQHTDYSCGAAALQAVLAYYGIDVREDTLMQKLGTNEIDGTKYWEIVRVAREYGLTATTVLHMSRDEMISKINRGIPVLIAIQAWIQEGDPRNLADWKARKDDGHYVIAIGYDDRNIYFEDPAMFGIGYIAFDELEARWHDFDQNGNRLDHFAITFEGDRDVVKKKPPLYYPIN
jgi:predicted double-glycine peptidase